jgi:AcrR family transcriptional regulator
MNTYSFDSETSEVSAPSLLDRKQRHRLLRKTDIIRAAEHVFALKGFHKATIQDIARQAQYATGTVYLYFEDKNSLYFSIVVEKIKRLVHILKLKTSQVNGARKKLEAAIMESLLYFQEDKDFFRIFVQEESPFSIKSRLAKTAISRERKDFSVTLIREAQAEGLLRKDTPPERISDMLESIITAFIFSWCEEGGKPAENLKEAAAMIMDLFLNGVKKK